MNRRRPLSAWMTRPASLALAAMLGVALLLVTVPSTVAGTTPPPKNVEPPTIDGVAQEGRVLRVDVGTWQPSPRRGAPFAYQWQLCDPTGSACANVDRATDSVYTVRHTDVGRTLRVVVAPVVDPLTAPEGDESASVVSAPTGVVAAAAEGAPIATVRPAITGAATVGATLTVQSGAWEGTQPIRLRYRWRICNAVGGSCTPLRRHDDTFVIRAKDLGHTLRALVRARNPVGHGAALTDPTPVVVAAPGAVAPKPTAEPAIDGTARAGQTLHATRGTWTGTPPLSFAYRWVRCGSDGGAPDGSNCATIAGATGVDHRLTGDDVGKRLRVVVTSSNDAGSQTAASNATQTVQAAPAPAPPRNTREPAIAGPAVQGQTLRADGGTWVGTQPMSFTYQWVRCGADGGKPDGSNCAFLSHETGTGYRLSAADVGHRIRVRVTARNAGGTAVAASNPTSTVEAPAPPPSPAPPHNTHEPTIAGTPEQGDTLTASGGTWVGASPITLTYQWVRCDAGGGKPDGSDCPGITGATTTKYVPAAADVGKRLRVRVTGRGPGGTLTVASNPTPVISATQKPAPSEAGGLANGTHSVPVSSVSLPARLIIDRISFTPNPVRTRHTVIRLRVHVIDTQGLAVRDALVFARSTPLVTRSNGETRTGRDGWATVRLAPRRTFRVRNGYNVQFFVRARKPGDPILAGVSTRRLVQVRTHR